jgi:phenylacetate-coenzyme A ligase PaaK-like adenylate-forming protein
MIRYLNGDLAVVRSDARCACGRALTKIGPIEGRVTDTLYDGSGHAVGGLVFNVLFGLIGSFARNFQVTQRADRSIVMKIVPFQSTGIPAREERILRDHAARYLPGAPFAIEIVDDIPLSASGKRRVVVVEKL